MNAVPTARAIPAARDAATRARAYGFYFRATT